MSDSNTNDTRRDTLKIIGAIGTTCAFPFSANELYGQQEHQHGETKPPAAAGPYTPKFLKPDEYAEVSRISELIIPQTETPGAIAAGVPQYIDDVLGRNKELLGTIRDGLAWLNTKNFSKLDESSQIALLTPLSEACDRGLPKTPEEKFFRAIKNLTSDGYYTSYAGLVQELGYKGNQALASFPSCELPAK